MSDIAFPPLDPVPGAASAASTSSPDASGGISFPPLEPEGGTQQQSQVQPRYRGALSNSDADYDGIGGALAAQGKLAATAGVEGATSSVTGGGLEYLTDLGLSGAESLARSAGHYFNHNIEQKSPYQIYQELQQQKAAMEQKFAQRRGFNLPQTGEEAATNLQKGIFSKTGAYEATNPAERLEMAGLAGAAGMVAPGPGLPGSAGARSVLGIPIGSAPGAASAAIRAIPAGAVSGVAAQGATDVTGSPYAGLAAGIIAPSAMGAAAARTGIPKALETNLTPKAVAGRALLESSSDPEAMKQWAAVGPQPDDTLVPGSQPTTFQVTGDQGIGQYERQVRTASPADFLERANEQNKARVEAMQGIEPQGHVQDLADFVTGQFRNIDDMTQRYADAAKQDAQQAAGSLGPGALPEAHGEAIRTLLAAQRQATTAEEGRLWDIINPNNTLISNFTPLRQAAEQTYGNLPKASQATLTPAEQTFRGLALQYPDAAPFSELQAFKSALGEAIRQERSTNGKTQALRRLTALQDGVYGSINDTVAGKIAQDNAAVAAGQMAPEDAMTAKAQGWQNDFYAAKTAGQSALTGSVGNAGTGSRPVPGLSGTKSQANVGSGPPSGDQSLPVPNFTEADRQALAAARASTQARVQTFDKGPVGKILAPGQNANTYKLSDSLVPQKVFVSGPAGGEAIDAYRAAAGNDPQAETVLQNAISDSLTAKGLDKDGNVAPGKLAKWQQDYGPALSRMDPAFTQKFQNAADATASLSRIQQARKAALDAYQKSAFGRLIGAADPTTTERVVGGMFGSKTAVRDFRQLAQEAAKDKTGAATQGLRRAILDHIETRFLKNIYSGNEQQAAINAAAFQRFVRQNNTTLRQAFEPAQADMLNAISNDLARSNQSVVNKVPGPGTAQDILPYLKQAGEHKESLLWSLGKSLFAAREVSEAVGHGVGLHTLIPAAVASIGAKLIGALKNSGMHKVADLVKEGVLNPDVGRALIMRASKAADQGSQHALATALQRAMISAQTIH